MSFNRILVPLDGSQLAEESLPHATRLARVYGSQVMLLHVLRSQPSAAEVCADSVDWRLHRLEILSYLKRIADQLIHSGIHAGYHVADGRPAEQIVEYACDQAADLMVLSAYGWGGISQFPFGSTVQKVMSVPCSSYLVVRPGVVPMPSAEEGYRRILVPVDGSQRSEWAVGQAASLARAQKAELILLQVILVPEMLRRTPMTPEESKLRSHLVDINRAAAEQYLDDLGNRFRNEISLRTQLRVSATVGSTIRQVAADENVDLIALSAHGGSEIPNGSCGSVSRSILAHCRQPVLIFQDQPHEAIQQDLSADTGGRAVRAVYGM